MQKGYSMDIITISLVTILTFEYDPVKSAVNLEKHGIISVRRATEQERL